jgi:hypothetical protein
MTTYSVGSNQSSTSTTGVPVGSNQTGTTQNTVINVGTNQVGSTSSDTLSYGGRQYSPTATSGDANLSLPSVPVVLADVPEVNKFTARFVYNFFVPDEGSSEQIAIPKFALKKNASTLDANLIDLFNTRVPRYVELRFMPVRIPEMTTIESAVQFKVQASQASVVKGDELNLIGNNYARIMSEEKFAGNKFIGFELQDDTLDNKLYNYISGTIANYVNKLAVQRAALQAQQTFNAMRITFQDGIDILNAHTPPSISDKFLDMGAAAEAANKRIEHYTKNGEKIIKDEFAEIKASKIRVQFNSRFAAQALASAIHDPINMFSDELKQPYLEAKRIQQVTRTEFDGSMFNAGDYDTQVDYVKMTMTETSENSNNTRIVGYVIDKFEQTEQGLVSRRPIILEGSNATSFFDTEVRYGASYVYAVRAIAEIRVPVLVNDTTQMGTAKFLISSRRTAAMRVPCIETVAPPTPSNVKFTWDHDADGLRLTWDAPVNRQRDIKKFQVFRRRAISERFELVKMFDFNDSTVIFPSNETPIPSLVERCRPGTPVTTWVDYEFRRNCDRFIYAVCAEDAHGMSSNYSSQFEVWFDPNKNRVMTKLISHSGAPKPYPNLYLQRDLFPDTVHMRNFSRVRIAFQPEAYSVKKGLDGAEIDVVATNQDKQKGHYLVQFINTDVQKMATVQININDTTPSAIKDNETVISMEKKRPLF